MNLNTSETEKKCPKCGEIKNRQKDYYKIKGESIKVGGVCKSCLKKFNAERKREAKKLAVKYKGGCCSKCGYNKSLNALDFHHVNPSQKNIKWNSFRNRFNDKLKKELDKCILLCANCHREIHE